MEGERERGTGERGGRKGERGRREGGRVREAGSKAPKRKLSDISNTPLTQPTASVCSAGESCGTTPAGRHTAATVLRATTSSLSNLSSEQSNMLDKWRVARDRREGGREGWRKRESTPTSPSLPPSPLPSPSPSLPPSPFHPPLPPSFPPSLPHHPGPPTASPLPSLLVLQRRLLEQSPSCSCNDSGQ